MGDYFMVYNFKTSKYDWWALIGAWAAIRMNMVVCMYYTYVRQKNLKACSWNGGGHSTFFWWVCATRVSKSRVEGADFSLKNEGSREQKFGKFAS